MAMFVENKQFDKAHNLLNPVLCERTPFKLLDIIGENLGEASLEQVNSFLEQIAESKTEGGWVVIASALKKQLNTDRIGALNRCKTYIIAADVWYATDIFGERVVGSSLLTDFQSTLEFLEPWREDNNRWIRRTIGVAVHLCAKRFHGVEKYVPQIKALLVFLEPMFEEWEIDAVKGIGWGLKTLGRYYPDLAAGWLAQQVVHKKRRYRTLMLRKALTYLSEEHRSRARGDL